MYQVRLTYLDKAPVWTYFMVQYVVDKKRKEWRERERQVWLIKVKCGSEMSGRLTIQPEDKLRESEPARDLDDSVATE